MSALSGSVRSSVCRLFQRSKGCRVSAQRCKSSLESPTPDLNHIPLTQPAPSIPLPIYATVPKDEVDTNVTTLKNGLRVASENKFGQFCTVGVIVDSGSRYEVAYPSGISHFLERLAFNSTVEFSSKDDMMVELEKYGGICDCQSSRDTIIYATSVNAKGLDAVVKLLAEVVLRPKILEQEVANIRTMIQFELEDTALKPEQEPLLTEMIHAAAYSDNTLGLPKLCPVENISVINPQLLFTYLNNHYTPDRMVVAGVGVEHDKLVEYTNRHFVEKPALWQEKPDLCLPQGAPADFSLSQYTGGLVQVEKDLSNVSLGPTPIPELAHLVLGLESSSHQDPDFIAFCVLNMLMGGGGSFSAGGPGKGMYTRLYTNVLNRFHWMYNATAYNHAYSDSGIFCIHASAHPSQLKDLVEVIVKEFVNMAGHVEQSELERAKTQLQSMLLMNLESRPVVFEDIARQVLATGHRKTPNHFIQAIGAIQAQDVQRAALRLLRSKPSVAALGNTSKLPPLAHIEAGLVTPEGRMPRKFSLFRSASP